MTHSECGAPRKSGPIHDRVVPILAPLSDPHVLTGARQAPPTVTKLLDAAIQARPRPEPWLSIVLPVRNEVGSLVELHCRLSIVLNQNYAGVGAEGSDWEIIFVNDGSRDGTTEVLRDLAAADPRVVVLNLRRGFGQTAALAAGIEHAGGQIIVTMDADLQHLPEEIPLLVQKVLDGHEMVIGYRADRSDDSLLRRIPSRLANALMRRISGVRVRDFGSTFKAFQCEVVRELELFGEVHRFIPVLGAMTGCDTVEVPITNSPRQKGKSKYGIGRTFGVLVDIISIGVLSSYITRPGRPWGYAGLIMSGVGLIIQATLLTLYVSGALYNILERPGWLLLSVLLEATGLQCLGFGFMSELLGRTYFASRSKPIYSIRSIHGGRTVRRPSGRKIPA